MTTRSTAIVRSSSQCLAVWAAVLLLVPTLVSAQGSGPGVNRLDPILRLAAERTTALEQTLARGEELPSLDRSLGIMAAPSGLEVLVEVIVRGSGSEAAVRAAGGTVRSRLGSIVTARVPLSSVKTLASAPGVEYVEASTENRIAMDAGLDSIRADTLHSGAYGYRGSGVLVCVYDTGLDYTHDDFRNGDGTTRVVSMWDQTDDTGTAPSGYAYGSEWSQAQINDEIDGSPAGVVTQQDINGHGTHVMGIAAGNGRATGNGEPDSTYVGVAPAADLLVVKGGDGSFSSADIVDGISWTFAEADALGQPCVMNLSLGGHSGPHDGTSLYEQAIDTAVGTGKVIVVSAGNEGNDALHDRTSLSTSGATVDSFSFTIPSYTPTSGTSNDYILCNIWYEGSTGVSVKLKNPYGGTYGPITTGNSYGANTSLGYVYIDNASGGVDARNGDYQCILQIYDAAEGQEPESGSWTIIYELDSGTSTPADMWFYGNTIGAEVDVPTSYRSAAHPGTASGALTVGAWVSKWGWGALDGSSYTYTGSDRTSNYALFSSWGPTRDGRQKPEIAAPGKGIMAAMSSQMSPPSDPWRDPDGVHRMSQGTSQAAPVVTGTVALLLEIDDTQTASQIKTLLEDNAQVDSWTGGVPNATWGYGKLDALAAADDLLQGLYPPSIHLYQPTGVQQGYVTIEYLISDTDSSAVGLLVEGSGDYGVTWQPLTFTGDTSAIAPADYAGSIVWNSLADLPDDEAEDLYFRITPYDAGGWGIADTTYGDVDNRYPQWVAAAGVRGDSSFTFWFNEPVADSSLTKTWNVALSTTATIDSVTSEGTWSEADSLATARWNSATGVIDEKIYVAGGYYGSDSNALEAYEPLTDTWSTLASMTYNRRGAVAGAIDEYLYVAGGYQLAMGGLASVEIYNAMTDTWSAGTSLPAVRSEAAGDVIGGRLYLVGGTDGATYKTDLYVYDPGLDTWSTLQAATITRGEAGAAVIDEKLYVAGGWDGSVPLADVEVYDPATDIWTLLPDMPTARRHPECAAVGGKLYIFGGYGTTGYLDAVEVYDPAAGIWSIPATMPITRRGPFVEEIEGLLYVGAGYDGSRTSPTMDIFDPQTRLRAHMASGESLPSSTVGLDVYEMDDYRGNTLSWADTTFTPSPNPAYRPTVHVYQPASIVSGSVTIEYAISDPDLSSVGLLVEGKEDIYADWTPLTVIGDTSAIAPADYDSSLVWDSDTDAGGEEHLYGLFRITPYDEIGWGEPDTTWFGVDNAVPMWIQAEGVEGDSVVTFWFNELVADTTATNTANISLSGGYTIDSVSVYDSWSTDVDSLATGRNWAGSATIGEKLYVVGGHDGGYFATLQVFDRTTGAWTTLSPMPTARRAPVVGAIDNKLYVVGGYNGSYLPTLEIYDTDTDTWSTGPSMLTARGRAAGGVINGRLYVVGGYDGSYLGLNECYDPATGSWSTKTSIPTLISEMAAGVINGKLYIAGGWNGSLVQDCRVYNPESDSWSLLPNLPAARRDARGGVIGGRFYVAGGNNVGFIDTLEVYDPIAGTWTGLTSPPVQLVAPTVSVLDDTLYTIGGHDNTSFRGLVMTYTPQDCFDAHLTSGQTLPAEGTSLTITATGIPDEHGNTATSLQDNFLTDAGAPSPYQPDVSVCTPSGTESGDIIMAYRITDTDSSLVGLIAEYSIDGGSSWSAATVSGDTSDISKGSYDSFVLWHSDSDLADQTFYNMLFRMIPYDSGGEGTPGQVYLNLDNTDPASVAASGYSGYNTLRFSFNEAVAESSATNDGNFTLSGGLTPDSIAVVHEIDEAAVTVPAFKKDAGVGAVNGLLYVVSGTLTNTSGYTNTVEVYDPATNTWDTAAPIPTARRNPLVLGFNGKLYVAGGEDGSGGVAVLEIYDPATDSWSTSGSACPVDHTTIYFSGAATGDAWYVNEWNGSNAYIHKYDPFKDSWTTLSVGKPAYRVSTAYVNGKIYLAGGYSGTVRSDCLVFDPGTELIGPVAGMSLPRYDANVGVIDGHMWAVSGYNTTTIDVYDPVKDVWHYSTVAVPVKTEENQSAVIDETLYVARVIDQGGFDVITFDLLSWNELELTMSSGDRLPPPPQTVTLTASSITDRAGNTATGVQTTFTPSSGNVPDIALYHPAGPQSGNIDIDHVITDDENNPVWMLAEYSTDAGVSWQAATVTGDTADVEASGYDSTLTWASGTDLGGENHPQALFRVRIRDNGSSWGDSDTVVINVDNAAPQTITAEGYSGAGSFLFWFDEPVNESDAANPANVVLSGGTQTIDAIAVNSRWESDALTVPTTKIDVGVGTLDGKLYVAGGYANSAYQTSVQVYDPATGTWDTTTPMNTPRRDPLVVGLDGLLYVLGGNTSSAEVWDPEADSWTALSPAPYSLDKYHAVADVINGRIYVYYSESGGRMLIYDPNVDSWENRDIGLARGGPAVAAIGDYLYIAGGYNSSVGYSVTAYRYDPATDNLTPLTDMPTGRNNCVAGVIDGRFYVAGGYASGSGTLDVVEVYDPVTTNWTSLDPAPHASDTQCGAVLDETFYFARESGDYTWFDAYDRLTFEATLSTGQGLPTPQHSLTLTATGINDQLGNTASSINTPFSSSVGDPAGIGLYGPTGVRSGDVTIGHLITDTESNPVWLKTEYSTDRTTWSTATLSAGSLDSVTASGYEADLTWNSAANLSAHSGIVWFRVTLREEDSWAAGAEVPVRLDNAAPASMGATGLGGATTLDFWFDEPVSEESATATGNFSLTEGLTAQSITPITTWTQDALTPITPRHNVGIGVLGNRIYVISGYSEASSDEVTTVEAYDLTTNQWVTLADIPRKRQHPLVAGLNGKLYVLGGYDNGTRDYIDVYDPVSDTWESLTVTMPFSGQSPESFDGEAIDGKLYINFSGMVYTFDPLTGSWSSVAGGLQNAYAATAALGGKLYILGGNNSGYRSDLVVYDPATGVTTTLTGMPTARRNPGTAVFGGRIFAAGGYDGSSLSTLEIYDPATDSWTTGPDAPQNKNWDKAVSLGGTFYFGGYVYRSDLTANTCVFDTYTIDGFEMTVSGGTLPNPPTTITVTASNITDWAGNTITGTLDTTFTATTGQAPSIRLYQLFGTQAQDVAIGYELTDPEGNAVSLYPEYSLDDGLSWEHASVTGDTSGIVPSPTYFGTLTWNSVTDLPDQLENIWFRITPRDNDVNPGTADTLRFRLANQAIESIGASGNAGEDTFTFWFDRTATQPSAVTTSNYSLTDGLTIDAISPAEQWTAGTDLPLTLSGAGAAEMGGKIYLAGGYDGAYDQNTLHIYDPAADAWTSGPPMSSTRNQPAVAAADGRLVVIGDVSGIEIYDPLTGNWSSSAHALFVQSPAVATIEDRIYIAGGWRSGGYSADLTWYDPASDSLATLTARMTACAGSAFGVIDGLLYVAGGYDGAVTYTDLEIYDPVTDTWSYGANLPSPVAYAASGVIDGQLYVASGYAGAGNSPEVFRYDPATDSWTTLGNVERPFQSVAVALDGKLYVLGGHGEKPDGSSGNLDELKIYDPAGLWTGTLTSPQTLPFEQLTLQASGITDILGNTSGTVSVEFIPDDGNDNPTVVIDPITVEVSGDVTITATITDTEGDPCTVSPNYSLDGGSTWSYATTVTPTTGITPNQTWQFVWNSQTDAAGLDLTDARFQLNVWDNDVEQISAHSDEITFHLDNNEVPAVDITESFYTSTDTTWTFLYDLSDTESDTLSIRGEYSDDTGLTWWPATTDSDTSGIAAAAYSDSLTWYVQQDLPDATREVLFRIVPIDNDEGTADEEAVRLNLLGLPEITLTGDLSGELTEDIVIDYEADDPDSDPIDLVFEYEYPAGTWNTASCTGSSSLSGPSAYVGSVTWNSVDDLGGLDVTGVTFRITPRAGDGTDGFSDSAVLNIDNNAVPSFSTLTAPTVVTARDVAISFTLNDDEGDDLALWTEYTTGPGQSWQALTMHEDMSAVSPTYPTGFTWDSFADLGYADHDSVQVRIFAADNDTCTAMSSDWFAVTNYVGDYSGDLAVDFSDFATLVTAWNAQDTYHDIGPATGTVPDLVPTGDGQINYEDLAVYAQMWTWSDAQGSTSAAVQALARVPRPASDEEPSAIGANDQHPVMLRQPEIDDPWAADTGRLELILDVRHIPALAAAGFALSYDPEHLRLLEISPGTFLGREGTAGNNLITLKRVSEETGTIELMLGRIAPERPEVAGSGRLATLRFEKLSEENSDLALHYDLRDRRADAVVTGAYATTVEALRLPDEFALLPNYPNPFNAETVIRFQLPTAQRVRFYVLNVRGQRVATLADREYEPGYHTIRWDGRSDDGRRVASGIYIYLIQAGPHRASKKMTIIK